MAIANDHNLTERLNQLAAGEVGNFEAIYRHVILRIRAMASRFKRQEGIAAETIELADDVLLRVAQGKNVATFDNREKFYSYVCRITKNTVRDRGKMARAQVRHPRGQAFVLTLQSDDQAANVMQPADLDTRLDLLDWLSRINEPIAFVYRKRIMDGWDVESIASEMKLSSREVESHWDAGLELIRQLYKKKRVC